MAVCGRRCSNEHRKTKVEGGPSTEKLEIFHRSTTKVGMYENDVATGV